MIDTNENFYVTLFLYYQGLSRQEKNVFTHCRGLPWYEAFIGQDLEYFLGNVSCCRENTH